MFVRRLVKFYAFYRKLYHTQYKCQDKNSHPPKGLNHLNRRKRNYSRSRNNRYNRDKRYRLERRSNRDQGRRGKHSRSNRDVNPAYYNLASEDSDYNKGNNGYEGYLAIPEDKQPKCYIATPSA